MFELKQRGTVIAEGLKIVGNVTAEELVESMVKSKVSSPAPHSSYLAMLTSRDRFKPSNWLWTGRLRARFKAAVSS